MTYYHHEPVLLETSVSYLVTDKHGIYVDATLGGGGHSKKILEMTGTDSKLFGIDQDGEAIKAATASIGDDQRFTALQGNFGHINTLVPPEFHENISGILFDLGVSTHQIKEAERGFSFQQDGPLDMRMSEMSGVSAYQVVNEYDYEKLRDVIFHYGEERMSRQIAREIISLRPIETTGELREAVENVVKGRHAIKSVARVFQGIRIEVNRELEVLKTTLKESLKILKPGGRMVAISYHSLEDRLVKNFFKSGNFEGEIKKDFYGNPLTPIKPLTKQIITPTEKEIQKNPASRSAKMRAAEKTVSEVS